MPSYRSSPWTSRTVSAANAASAASLTVTGYCSVNRASTSRPCAAAMPSHTATVPRRSRSRVPSEKLRTVAVKSAVSGMMLDCVPAWNFPTVSTTGSKTSKLREIHVWSAVTISQAAGIGSFARCGAEPCPPAPRTVTSSTLDAAMAGPPRAAKTPDSQVCEITCRAYAATGRSPAASSTPSSIMCPAPL